jgi:gliding motility-associated-like protein
VPTSLTALTSASSSPADVPLYCHNILTTCDYPYSTQAPPAGTPDGTLIVQYVSDTFSIPPGCTVTAEVDQGSRNAAITNLQNPSSTDIDIVASVTTPNSTNCENNPVFASFPVNIFCVGENANFSQGAIDLSGDSITYTLINPRNTGGTPIPFVAGCTPTNPLGAPTVFASTFTFNSSTGNVNFTPTQSGNYVMALEVDAFHSGTLVSTTMRDIQIVVIPCTTLDNPPKLVNMFDSVHVQGGVVYDSTHIGVCPGSPLQFELVSTDPDSFNYVKDSANFSLLLPGSTFTVTHSGTVLDTATLHVSWTPQNADSGFHYIYLVVSDTFCPRPGTRTYPFVISVLMGLYAGPNLVYCNGGQPVTIQAHGASHYFWTDSATGGPPVGVISYNADSSAITVAPGTSAGYVVHGNLIGSCKNLDTVSVKNAPLFQLSTHALDSAICKYSSTTISAIATPAGVGPYTYSWAPTADVISPTSATTAITSLLANTWYHVSVTAIGGCLLTDSVQVQISGSNPRITIIPSDNNVCPGDTVTLTGLAFAENVVNCGIVDTCADNTVLSSQAVGTDNNATTTIATPYNGEFPAARAQYLITAREMNAAGLSSGSVTDISFFVSQINSTVGYDSFTVSMGCTSLDSLTGFVNGLIEVAPATQVFPNLGWTPHPFTHYYNWDGSSNLIIQVCYTRTSTNFNNSDYVAYNQTTYNGSSVYDQDFGSGANGCGLNSFPTVTNFRPNIKIGMCAPNVLTYNWTPATLLCDTCAVTQVIVNADSTYKLTVHDNNCFNDSTILVAINKHIGIHAIPDTTLCGGLDSVRLNLVLTNPAISVCLQNYNVTSIPYAAITGAGISVPGTSYVDASGFADADEGSAGPYNIPFSFPFYCETFTQFWVDANGFISFVNPNLGTSTGLQAQSFPPSFATLDPQKMIVPVMGDYELAPTGSGNVKYFTSGTTPNRVFVVKFNAITQYPSFTGTNGVTNAEIHLHETSGVIDILIQNTTYSSDPHTTGIKDSTGLGVAAPGRNNALYTISTPEAWRFVPQNGPSVTTGTTVWSPNVSLSNDSILSPLAYPSATQTYYVDEYLTINQFTDPTTCHVRDSAKVTIASSFTHSLTASPLTICPGDTSQLTFTASTPIRSYTWTPASFLSNATISDPLAIVYDTTKFYVIATDTSGCRGRDSVTVNVLPTQHPQLRPDSTVCYNDSVLLSVAGAFSSYQWYTIDPVSGVRTPVSSTSSTYAHPSGYYIVKVLASGATCYYFSDTVHIDSFARQHLYITSSGPDSFCTGGNVVLDATQGLNNYLWSNAGTSQTVPVTTSGAYAYQALDANGCLLYSDTTHVLVTPPPSIAISGYKSPLCINETGLITVATTPAGIPVVWQQNGTQVATGDTYTVTTAGSYDIIAGAGCPTDSPFVIAIADTPVAVFTPSVISQCACDTFVTVTPVVTPASASDTYTWSADSSHGSSFNIHSTGTYTVTVIDANHCTTTATVNATLTCPQVTTTATPDTIFLSDTTILLATPVGSTITSYQWTAGDSAGTIFSPATASTQASSIHQGVDTFYVKVTDNNNCTNTVPVLVTVIELGGLRMPTAFTPNGDHMNDTFYPVLAAGSRVVAFRIYNRWGELVYNNPSQGWDGSYGEKPQATDTYLYFVTVESPDPNDATKKIQKSIEGNFQLFR